MHTMHLPYLPRRTHRLRYVRRLALVSLCALALCLLAPGQASAHAHLVQADPAPDSVIAQAPATASFVFDEPLNPALTRVRILTAAGRQVVAGGFLAPDHHGELWQLTLPRLPDGTYSVFWTSESAVDGHIINSFYTFRVAASGQSDTLGAVTGTPAGVYGGGGPSGSGVAVGGGVLATTLFSWLELMAQALWLGALVVELAVLARARRTAGTPAARLAWVAAPRLWGLVRVALVAAVWALVGEVISLALQGTGGDWGQALAPATLGGVLSSQNGHFLVLRLVVLVVALLAAARARVPAVAVDASASGASMRVAQEGRAPHALGIVAPALGAPRWESLRLPLALLAAVYMLLAAFSGHAADVSPGWLAYPIDWLHLVCTAAWAGGIAALAFGVVPAARLLAPDERVRGVLPLLDRFSPIAFIAVGVLALSGLYNAVNHVASPSELAGTIYGQLLVIKLILVGLLMALSASHVWGLRPRLSRLSRATARDERARRLRPEEERTPRDAGALLAIHKGLGALAARLRLEAGVGAAILLATALMGQTLPTGGSSASPAGLVPASISGVAATGDLRAQLTITPPAVGTATFTLRLWEQGTPLTDSDAAAIIHLFPASQPALRANLTPSATGTRFAARGSLPASGAWRADVLVRTALVNEYRTLRFAFTVGPGATFLTPAAGTVTIAVSPGRLSGPNTFTIAGLHAPAVRLLSQSLDMNMGILPYAATPLGGGRWRVSNAYAPMEGRWGLTVQVRQGGGWSAVRQFVYQVPLSGPMRLLTPQAPAAAAPGATAAGAASGPSRNLSKAYNLAFARSLPYTALVTEMGSNGVRRLGGPLLPTGLQAHGVDVLDGTPYAYVTNFGAEPGTVSQLDLRTMRVVRTFTVGLGPAHIAFTPDHRRAFVTDFRSSDLYMLDLRSGKTQRIAFPASPGCFEPHGIDISQDGHTLFVACAGGAWIYTVDTRTLKPGRVGITAPGTIGVAVDAPRHEVWATNQTVNTVSVLDERTLRNLATIHVGKGPALLVPTPDGRRVYVADQFGNEVSVIDAAGRRVIATIPVAAQPHGPDVTADGKYVYVASIGGNAVTIIRTSDNKVVAVVPSAVGSNEVAIAH